MDHIEWEASMTLMEPEWTELDCQFKACLLQPKATHMQAQLIECATRVEKRTTTHSQMLVPKHKARAEKPAWGAYEQQQVAIAMAVGNNEEYSSEEDNNNESS